MTANFRFYQLSEEEYNERNKFLHDKISNGLQLEPEEICQFCEIFKFEDLPKFAICQDEYLYRVFMEIDQDLPFEWRRGHCQRQGEVFSHE